MISSIACAQKHLEGTKNWWQVGIVAGIMLGAAISSTLSDVRRHEPSAIWQTVSGQGSTAARIADGCTSGHGISGMAQLAVGSFVAVGAMFTGGIATALLLKKRT